MNIRRNLKKSISENSALNSSYSDMLLNSKSSSQRSLAQNRKSSSNNGYNPTPRYDYSPEYDADFEATPGCSSPIGWICEAGHDLVCPSSDREKKFLSQNNKPTGSRTSGENNRSRQFNFSFIILNLN